MARKLRVYELARHYGVDSKTIQQLLLKMRVETKSHMSVVEDEHVDKIHAVFQRKRELARMNYARAHNIDPEKLKAVASLRPLAWASGMNQCPHRFAKSPQVRTSLAWKAWPRKRLTAGLQQSGPSDVPYKSWRICSLKSGRSMVLI